MDSSSGSGSGDERYDTVSSAMSSMEIIQILVKHHCPDITSELNLARCSSVPTAHGGSGDIFMGRLEDRKKVAIKCPRMHVTRGDEKDSQVLKRVARELFIWSHLKHENVLGLLGLAVYQDRMAMVSPWMSGGTLLQYIERNPDVDRYQLLVQISRGVAYLHEQGMTHGDLKSANVLVSGRGVAKIADFGCATLRNYYTICFTATTQVPGISIRWTAPEVLKGEVFHSKEADVYSLGMVFLEVVTGHIPFGDVVNDITLVYEVVHRGQIPIRPGQFTSFNDIQADLLWHLFKRMWAPEPSKRPELTTIQHYLQKIEKHSKGLPAESFSSLVEVEVISSQVGHSHRFPTVAKNPSRAVSHSPSPSPSPSLTHVFHIEQPSWSSPPESQPRSPTPLSLEYRNNCDTARITGLGNKPPGRSNIPDATTLSPPVPVVPSESKHSPILSAPLSMGMAGEIERLRSALAESRRDADILRNKVQELTEHPGSKPPTHESEDPMQTRHGPLRNGKSLYEKLKPKLRLPRRPKPPANPIEMETERRMDAPPPWSSRPAAMPAWDSISEPIPDSTPDSTPTSLPTSLPTSRPRSRRAMVSMRTHEPWREVASYRRCGDPAEATAMAYIRALEAVRKLAASEIDDEDEELLQRDLIARFGESGQNYDGDSNDDSEDTNDTEGNNTNINTDNSEDESVSLNTALPPTSTHRNRDLDGQSHTTNILVGAAHSLSNDSLTATRITNRSSPNPGYCSAPPAIYPDINAPGVTSSEEEMLQSGVSKTAMGSLPLPPPPSILPEPPGSNFSRIYRGDAPDSMLSNEIQAALSTPHRTSTALAAGSTSSDAMTPTTRQNPRLHDQKQSKNRVTFEPFQAQRDKPSQERQRQQYESRGEDSDYPSGQGQSASSQGMGSGTSIAVAVGSSSEDGGTQAVPAHVIHPSPSHGSQNLVVSDAPPSRAPETSQDSVEIHPLEPNLPTSFPSDGDESPVFSDLLFDRFRPLLAERISTPGDSALDDCTAEAGGVGESDDASTVSKLSV